MNIIGVTSLFVQLLGLFVQLLTLQLLTTNKDVRTVRTVRGNTSLFKSKNNNDTKERPRSQGLPYVRAAWFQPMYTTGPGKARPGESSVLIYKTD